MSVERKTQLANEILIELLNSYKETQVKIFLATINKFLAMCYAQERDNGTLENVLDTGMYHSYSVEIPLEFYKEYTTSKAFSKEEWKEIVKSIVLLITIKEGSVSRSINIIDEVDFDKETDKFTVVFDEKYIEYVLLLNRGNFSILDLEEVRKLKGKFELGLYFIMKQYKSTGKAIFTMDRLKHYFGKSGCSDKYILEHVRKSIENMNSTFNCKFKLDTIKNGRNINDVVITFPKNQVLG